MKKLFLSLILILLTATSVIASDGGAQFISLGPFFNASSVLYPLPKVYHYASGTDTLKNCWSDEGKVTPVAQPFIGDAYGVASMYCDGDYKFVIKDTDGNTLRTWNNYKVTSDTATMWEGNFGLSYPTAATANRWQLFAKVDGSNNFLELGINEGTAFKTIGYAPYYVDAGNSYTTFAAAITTCSTDPCVIVLSNEITLEAAKTIDANTTLVIQGAGEINFGNYDLTLNGQLIASRKKIFDYTGTGKLVPAQKAVKVFYPEYWGNNTAPGTTVMTEEIQACINVAATAGVDCKVTGYNLFGKLYFNYDAVNNPNFPQTYQGAFKLSGDLAPSKDQIDAGVYTKGTVLVSNDATGPAINISGASGTAVRAVTLSDMAIVASNTTYVLDASYINNFMDLQDVTIQQNGAGGGVIVESCWVNKWENVFVTGGGVATSDVGIIFRTLAGESGGGDTILINVNSKDFDKCWEFGHPTQGSGNQIQTITCIGCQASNCATYGVLIGHYIEGLNWIGSYVEQVQDGANGGIGMWVKNNSHNVTILGSVFQNNDIGFQAGSLVAGYDRAYHNIVVDNNQFKSILVKGVQVYGDHEGAIGLTLRNNNFVADSAPPGNTTGIHIDDNTHIGLVLDNNTFEDNLTYDIANAKYADILIARDSGGHVNMTKLGRIKTLTADDATPSVLNTRLAKTNNANATSYIDLTDGIVGQEVKIHIEDTHTTVDFTNDGTPTTLRGNSGVDWSPSNGDWMECVFGGTNWWCAVHDTTL